MGQPRWPSASLSPWLQVSRSRRSKSAPCFSRQSAAAYFVAALLLLERFFSRGERTIILLRLLSRPSPLTARFSWRTTLPCPVCWRPSRQALSWAIYDQFCCRGFLGLRAKPDYATFASEDRGDPPLTFASSGEPTASHFSQPTNLKVALTHRQIGVFCASSPFGLRAPTPLREVPRGKLSPRRCLQRCGVAPTVIRSEDCFSRFGPQLRRLYVRALGWFSRAGSTTAHAASTASSRMRCAPSPWRRAGASDHEVV